MKYFLCSLYILCICLTNSFGEEEWKGKWFPYPPGHEEHQVVTDDPDSHHVMGIPTTTCDDAKTNLEMDWDRNPLNYTCFDRYYYTPEYDVSAILQCDHIPPGQSALHYCMNKSIKYRVAIPTFGPHRPLWAKYGEHLFLPPQRWLHNLEHGAIVMLYHPCANPSEVQLLKKLLKSCMFRHIITPNNLLTPQRPLALVSWGCRLTMSKVDPGIVTTFIKQYAKKGPERVSRNGHFDGDILHHAQLVSDQYDKHLCPFLNE